MAYSNCCNCSGGCGSMYGSGYARRNNNSWYRNSYAALNTVPACTRYRNYPFYTGNCPDVCGCYHCGCAAGVTNQNCRCRYGNNHHCNACDCCDHCGSCDSCSTNCCSCNNSTGCGNCTNNCTCGTCGNCCGNTCDLCGCGENCCDCSCGNNCCHLDSCGCPVYGLFSANAPVTVTAGAAIPLAPTTVSTNDFTVSNGTVTINRCGTYLATYTVNIPAGSEVDTTIVMNVNGVTQPSTLLSISEAGSYTGQTVFTANTGATVSLVSNAAFTVSEPIGQNVVALTLTRIG